MTIPRYALLARKALVEADAAIRPRPAASPASDAATVHAIEAVLRQSARRRTLTRVSAGTFAMAAAAALVFLGVHGRRDASTSTREAPVPPVAAIVVHASGDGAEVVGGHPEVGGDQALPPGARVVALPHGHALLSFASGTHVNIDEGGDVTVIDEGATQILSLAGGALKADVAKLKPGERFLVRTDDAEIEVHGTSFRVARVSPDSTCGAGTRTRLNVFEGVVTIRSAGTETRVTPGGSWPADCSEHPMTPPAAPAPVIRPVTTSSARSDATLEHPASPALPGVAASPGGPGLAAAKRSFSAAGDRIGPHGRERSLRGGHRRSPRRQARQRSLPLRPVPLAVPERAARRDGGGQSHGAPARDARPSRGGGGA
jgi:hypothetical protein